MKTYLLNVLIAVDQLLNTVFKGTPDETLSSRAYRLYRNNKYWYSKIPYTVINTLFFWQDNHCKSSYKSELQRKHLPEEFQ